MSKILNIKTKTSIAIVERKEGETEVRKFDADYEYLVKLCVDRQPEGGLSIDDIDKRMRIKNALKEAKGTLVLEDEDAKNLKGYVESFRWWTAHEDIQKFVKDIREMKPKNKNGQV